VVKRREHERVWELILIVTGLGLGPLTAVSVMLLCTRTSGRDSGEMSLHLSPGEPNRGVDDFSH